MFPVPVLLAIPLALALAALAGGERAGRAVALGCLGCALGAALLGAAALAGASGPALALPDAAGLALRLGPDALSGWFLLVFGLGTAVPLARMRPCGAATPALLAAALVALCADGLAGPLLGLGTAAALAHGTGRVGAPDDGAVPVLAAPVAGGACLLAAAALLGPAGAGFDAGFDALRAAPPPEGGRAAAVLLLALTGAALSCLTPLRARPTPRDGLPPGLRPALAAALVPYLLARLLLDVAGPAQPGLWGVPLLLGGGGLALFSALRAGRGADARRIADDALLSAGGLSAAGLGLAAMFRAADLGAPAALAAGAALLHGLHAALAAGLLRAAFDAAGGRDLSRAGGLIHVAPRAAAVALVAAASLAALPPAAGFASAWLLLQSLLAGWRVGEIGLRLALVAALPLFGVSLALVATAMLRAWGLVFLGRPRGAAPASRTGLAEPRGAGFAALWLPAAALFALALRPGLALGWAVAAVRSPAAGNPPAVGGWWLSAWDGGPGFAPAAVAALLAACGVGLVALARRGSPGGLAPDARRAPAWEQGDAPRPAADAPALSLPVRWPDVPGIAANLAAAPLSRALRDRAARALEAAADPGGNRAWLGALAVLFLLLLGLAAWSAAPGT